MRPSPLRYHPQSARYGYTTVLTLASEGVFLLNRRGQIVDMPPVQTVDGAEPGTSETVRQEVEV